MSPAKLLIVYATTYGQTAKIAKRIAEVAVENGVAADVTPVDNADDFSLEDYQLLIVAGSVLFGRHQKKLEQFVQRKLTQISAMEAAFVSVSGSAAVPSQNEQAEAYVHRFARKTGWVPEIYITFGGAESYTKYGFFARLLIRMIARSHGRKVDVHRDYEFTDWAAVNRFTHEFLRYATAKKSA